MGTVKQGRRKRINEGIEQEEWKDYFMGLLGGVERRVILGWERRIGGRKEGIDEEKEISGDELKRAMKKLRDGKAIGLDGIPGEAWKYGGEKLERWVRDYCNEVWRGEGWPENWKEGVIVPIVKKGEGVKIKEYRGVTIMAALYKIYVSVLEERRLRMEIFFNCVIIFKATTIWVRTAVISIKQRVNLSRFIINRQLGRGKGVTAMIVDLKAAFDSIDRRVLVESMEERGIRRGLVKKVKEVLRETKSRVRIGEEMGESFWTGRGLRQGCPLSPLLLNILMADIEEELGKIKWGGIKLRGRRIYSLAYADDLVLLTKKEEEMRSLIERLEGYLDRKKLEMNVGKTKIMRCRRGKQRERGDGRENNRRS